MFTFLFVIFRLVTNPFKAKYSSSRLEKVVRDCFFQENHFLPFRNRATKCRSNTNSWSKVSLLTKSMQLIFINCFAYFCLQQSIPCAVSYPRWCHSRRSQRYPKNIPGKQFIFAYFLQICLYICLHFQILYAGEGESRKPEDNIGDDSISSVVSSSGNVVMNKSVIGSGKIFKNSTLRTSVPSLIIIFQVWSWKGTSSSRSHITCPPPATAALSPCGRPSDPHPR